MGASAALPRRHSGESRANVPVQAGLMSGGVWTVVENRVSVNGVYCPARIVSANNFSHPDSPSRVRKRVICDGSIGKRCWKNSSPQQYCQYGFSTKLLTTTSSDSVRLNLS